MAKRKEVTKSGNKRTVPITWKSLLGAAAFKRGFNEVKKGKPFDADGLRLHEQWHYERGRLFGVLYNGQLKNGRYVLTAAIMACAEAFRDKAIL